MNLKNPFEGGFKVTSPYGERSLNGKKEMHNGLDIVGLKTDRVRAIAPGRVVSSRIVTDKSDPTWQWGNYVCILDDEGFYYYYCHLRERSVSYGDSVKSGDLIGIMGNTGYSFGAHTHLEIRYGSTAVNAADFMSIANAFGEYDLEADSISPWAEEGMLWAKESGIIKGKNGRMAPRDPCTREELAVMLFRFYKYLEGI